MSTITDIDLDRMSHWAEDGQVSAEDQRSLVLEVSRLRALLVFADGAALTGLGMPLARLYAEDCEWAQQTLQAAGCHSRDAQPIDFDAAKDLHACIGGDYCGRMTNGWCESGSHGPGYYCGWCEAIPA